MVHNSCQLKILNQTRKTIVLSFRKTYSNSSVNQRSFFLNIFAVMNMEDSRTQRPYRYGMILLCLGAIINWLGLSETSQNGEPIRYLGVACILGKYLYSINK